MNNFLYKINSVKTNNQIVRLKKENELKDKKMEEVVSECKNIVLDFQAKSKNKVFEMNEKINKLEDENNELRKQRDFYKDSLEKMPKFIVKMFSGKNKMLEKGEENG